MPHLHTNFFLLQQITVKSISKLSVLVKIEVFAGALRNMKYCATIRKLGTTIGQIIIGNVLKISKGRFRLVQQLRV